MNDSVRTRFAPSPTGFLHIGGVRTALFNWLVARHAGGQFILRIDDTDRGRNRPEAVQPILDGFRWLGLDWDEGPNADGTTSFGPHAPYFQSQRNDTYVEAAVKLISEGKAYPDYLTKEEQTQDRIDRALAAFRATHPGASAAQVKAEADAAAKGQRPYTFRGKLRDAGPDENLRRYLAEPCPVRFKVPAHETVRFTDLIKGRVREGDTLSYTAHEFPCDLIGDPVILRGPDPEDGVRRPLYNFATVVDEVHLKVTHVVRADEHFSNTPGQVLMFQALGAPVPAFAHVPPVNDPKTGKKLSKRDMAKFVTDEVIKKLRAVRAVPADATDDAIRAQELLNPATVEYYRVLGYLPSAVLNYLGRLGWSADDHTEYLELPELIARFGLDRVTESAAAFDAAKLYWLAGEHMNRLPMSEKVEGGLPFLRRAGLLAEGDISPELRAKLEAIGTAAAERLKLFSDWITYAGPFLAELPEYEPKAVADKLAKPGVAERLASFRSTLAAVEPFAAPQLADAFHRFAADAGIKPRDLDAPLRVAMTGTTVGISLPDTVALLGRETALKRLDRSIDLAKGNS